MKNNSVKLIRMKNIFIIMLVKAERKNAYFEPKIRLSRGENEQNITVGEVSLR